MSRGPTEPLEAASNAFREYASGVTPSTSTPRPIDLRRQQKQANRDAMVAAATDLFGSAGWAGTTMEGVAARSGMSVQSVYFAFHSKSGLLRAALESTALSRSGVRLDR